MPPKQPETDVCVFQLGYADISYVAALQWCSTNTVALNLHNFPKLKALNEKVEAVPKIAQQIENSKDLKF